MNAWQLPQLGSIDSLHLVKNLPDPQPAAGEVIIAVKFAALNPADRYLAEGMYPARPPMPHILGRDGVGAVVAVGEGVTNAKVGDVKAILRGDTGVSRAGTLATHVAVNADSLVDVPGGWLRKWTLEESAGAALVYVTAHQAMLQWGPLAAKSTILVTGATGGVGVAVVQLAKFWQATVVALSRSPEKSAKLKEIGADFVLDPSTPWPKYLKEQVGRRVNLAVDNVAGEGFNDVLNVMADGGRISVVGALAGPVPKFNTATLFARRLRIGGVFVSTYSREEAHAAWIEVVLLMHHVRQFPLVDRVFEFDQLPAAFARLKEGPMGKVLVRVG